jgi:hypothetical protein
LIGSISPFQQKNTFSIKRLLSKLAKTTMAGATSTQIIESMQQMPRMMITNIRSLGVS